MITEPLTAEDVRQLVQSTLKRMEEHEAAEALRWLEQHAMYAQDADTQLVMLETWMSVYDRLRWAQMYVGA